MSSRGWLVTSPAKKSSKIISESKRFIPLFWYALIYDVEWKRGDDASFELNRCDAIEGAQERLSFLRDVFSDISVFESAAQFLLNRLSKLRCETIGVDIAELAVPEPHHPTLAAALKAVKKMDASFTKTIRGRKQKNPFTGEMIERPAQEIPSTRALLLRISWLEQSGLDKANEEEMIDLINGHVWK